MIKVVREKDKTGKKKDSTKLLNASSLRSTGEASTSTRVLYKRGVSVVIPIVIVIPYYSK